MMNKVQRNWLAAATTVTLVAAGGVARPGARIMKWLDEERVNRTYNKLDILDWNVPGSTLAGLSRKINLYCNPLFKMCPTDATPKSSLAQLNEVMVIAISEAPNQKERSDLATSYVSFLNDLMTDITTADRRPNMGFRGYDPGVSTNGSEGRSRPAASIVSTLPSGSNGLEGKMPSRDIQAVYRLPRVSLNIRMSDVR